MFWIGENNMGISWEKNKSYLEFKGVNYLLLIDEIQTFFFCLFVVSWHIYGHFILN